MTDPFWRVLMTAGSTCPFLRMFFRRPQLNTGSLDSGDVMAFRVAGCSVQMARLQPKPVRLDWSCIQCVYLRLGNHGHALRWS